MNKNSHKQAQFLNANQAQAPVGGWGDTPHIVGGGAGNIQGNRRQLVGIPETVFSAGQTLQIKVEVTRACKPFRLCIPASIADNYSILGLIIQNKEQNLGTGPIPGEAFSQDSFATDLDLDTIPQGSSALLTVKATAAGTFKGNFFVAAQE